MERVIAINLRLFFFKLHKFLLCIRSATVLQSSNLRQEMENFVYSSLLVHIYTDTQTHRHTFSAGYSWSLTGALRHIFQLRQYRITQILFAFEMVPNECAIFFKSLPPPPCYHLYTLASSSCFPPKSAPFIPRQHLLGRKLHHQNCVNVCVCMRDYTKRKVCTIKFMLHTVSVSSHVFHRERRKIFFFIFSSPFPLPFFFLLFGKQH